MSSIRWMKTPLLNEYRARSGSSTAWINYWNGRYSTTIRVVGKRDEFGEFATLEEAKSFCNERMSILKGLHHA